MLHQSGRAGGVGGAHRQCKPSNRCASADPLIRYQLLKFCMNTRLSFLSRNATPDNMATCCEDRAHIGPGPFTRPRKKTDAEHPPPNVEQGSRERRTVRSTAPLTAPGPPYRPARSHAPVCPCAAALQRNSELFAPTAATRIEKRFVSTTYTPPAETTNYGV